MRESRKHPRPRPRPTTALVFALLCALVVGIGLVSQAGAAKTRALGKTKHTPNPSCPAPKGQHPPRKDCEVLGEVTGFQTKADGKKGLFKVPANGHLVAWSVDLSRPDKDERKFFENKLGDAGFGGGPTARLAVLKSKGHRRYVLKEQSPVVKLNEYFNQRPFITLNDPLRVEKGWIVALTTPTWIPNFAHGLTGDDTWKASRDRGHCNSRKDLLDRSRPHKNVGSQRKYGCTYSHARLLYWAYLAR